MSLPLRRNGAIVVLSAAVFPLLAGCTILQTLFPGLPVIPGTGTITVSRIVTTDPPDVQTDITFPLPTDFTDGAGFRWDIEDDGSVTDGGNTDFPDAFDGFMVLELRVHGFGEHEFEPGTLNAKLEDDREIVIGPIDQEGGLQIERKIYISPTQGFCRWLDFFINPTDTDIVVESENHGNLGSDEDNDEVFASFNGNTTVEDADMWWVDGQQFATDPTVGVFFCGTEGAEKDQDNVTFDYGMDMVVPAHSRNIQATYVFQRSPDRSSSESLLSQEVTVVANLTTQLKSLESFPAVDPVYLTGMTAAEVNDLHDCGGNVAVTGSAGAVAANSTVTITNTTNGDSRSGTANSQGGFTLNVKGVAGDTIQITTNAGTNVSKVVP